MKYLKYFEDFDTDGTEDEHILINDPIIKLILKKSGEITLSSFDSDLEFEIATSIYVYTTDYNEDIPYIHYLKNLLNEAQFRPGIGGISDSDLSETAIQIYNTIVDIDIHKTILESPDAIKILAYLKENDIQFFNYLKRFKNTGVIDTAGELGGIGF